MDETRRRAALGEFLRVRRAELAPSRVGLPAGMRRRTPGLRREEVAVTAGVSATWYTYLEQGRDIRVSRSVLENIADALRLTHDERLHLFLLADQAPPIDVLAPEEPVRPAYQRVLDSLGESPAYIMGRRTDILAWNRAAAAVFGDFAALPVGERNLLRLLYTNSAFQRRFAEWNAVAETIVATFRARLSPHLGDTCIVGFIEALGRASPAFRQAWARQHVLGRCTAWLTLEHPVAGRLTLELAGFQVSDDPEFTCQIYTAEPGSETAIKLHHLLSNPSPLDQDTSVSDTTRLLVAAQ